MGLWESIKNIGKSVVSGVGNFFGIGGGSSSGTSASISNFDWGQTLSNLLNTAVNLATNVTPYIYSEKASKEAIQANKEAMSRQYRYDRALMGYQNRYTKEQQKLQYNYNKELQMQNQDWQTQLSNTAHQREVADLKAAGINPLLSANGGASSPSGGIAAVGMGQSGLPSVGLTDDGQQVMAKVSNAIQWKKLQQDMKAINSNVALQKAEIELNAQKQNSEISQQQLNDSIRNLNKIEARYKDRRLEKEIGKLSEEIGLMRSRTTANATYMELMKSEMLKNTVNAALMGEQTGYWRLRNIFFGDRKSDNTSVNAFGLGIGGGHTNYD